MADSKQEPRVQLLCVTLEKLRGRHGLADSRLLESRRDLTQPLLELPAVIRYAERARVNRGQAAVQVVTTCVRESLQGSERIIADAVLALGAFRDEHRATIDERALGMLYSTLLRDRRQALLRHWTALHVAIGGPVPEGPSDRTLRGHLESKTLMHLAQALVRYRGDEPVPAVRYPAESGRATALTTQSSGGAPTGGKVVVIGGAVMDAVFRTKGLPEPETSTEATDFKLSPGGKGFTQAIAARRLGLDVTLVAAVGDDSFGDEIVKQLEVEGVETNHVKMVPHGRTPFTGVVEFPYGDSAAVVWRNETQVRLDDADVKAVMAKMEDAVVLMTLEPPLTVVEHTLTRLVGQRESGPPVILTCGPPYQGRSLWGRALGRVDFLVAHAWELPRLAPSFADRDVQELPDLLLDQGLGALCLLGGGGCSVYSLNAGTFGVPGLPTLYREVSASRDAFCAALALRIIEEGEMSEAVVLWATAAMTATTADFGAPDPMPDRRRVESQLRSRFLTRPST